MSCGSQTVPLASAPKGRLDPPLVIVNNAVEFPVSEFVAVGQARDDLLRGLDQSD